MSRIRTGSHNFLPNVLTASTSTGLFNLIKRLQRKEQTEFRFISFYYDSNNNEHVAWYYREINEKEEIGELTNELTSKREKIS